MNSKEIADIVIIPIVICAIGIWATNKSTQTQNTNARELAEEQYRLSERHQLQNVNIEALGHFYLLLNSNKSCELNNQIDMLISEVGSDLGKKMKRIHLGKCKDNTNIAIIDLENSSKIAIKASIEKQIKERIIDLSGAARRISRQELVPLFEEHEELVAQHFSSAIKDNFENYRITLGILVVLSKVNMNWDSTRELGEEILKLDKSPNITDPTFEKYLSKANDNKKPS